MLTASKGKRRRRPPSVFKAIKTQNLDLLQSALDWQNEEEGIWRESSLHLAARHGDVHAVRLLLTKLDVNCTQVDGVSVMHNAILGGREDVFDLVLEAGADPHAITTQWMNGLHLAAGKGRPTLVRRLLQLRLNVNAESRQTWMFPLHFAARSGCYEAVRHLLEAGAKIDSHTLNGKAAIHYAASSKSLETLKVLVDRGADVNSCDGRGRSVLHLAALKGPKEMVEYLLEKGADLSAVTAGATSVLQFAVTGKNEDVVSLLLQLGVDARGENKRGRTPLYDAARKGCFHLVQMLLDHGADPTAVNMKGETVLQAAVFGRRVDLCKMLVNRGIDVHSTDYAGNTLLHVAASRGHNVEVFEWLLSKGLDVNATNNKGESVLHKAAWKGGLEVCNILLLKGADPDAADKSARSVLHVAAEKGVGEIVILLLQHKVSCYTSDSYRQSVITSACKGGSKAAVLGLLTAGASPDAKDRANRGCLEEACKRGHFDVVKLLVEAGADTSQIPILMHATEGKDPKLVEYLLDRKVDVNGETSIGVTALQRAAALGVPKLVRILLKAGADIHAHSSYVPPALHSACTSGCTESVGLLLRSGADPESIDCYGRSAVFIGLTQATSKRLMSMMIQASNEKTANVRTPDGTTPFCMLARSRQQADLLQFFLDHGAELTGQSTRGETPLHCVAEGGYVELMKMALSKGADIHAENGNGTTVLGYAVSSRNAQKAVRFLLEHYGLPVENDAYKTIMWESVLRRDSESIREFLNFGADPNCVARRKPLVHIAAEQQSLHSVKCFLEAGANPDIVCTESDDRKALLHLTADNYRMLKLILKFGADVNVRDSNGVTPLHCATIEQNVRLLLDHGANPNHADTSGLVPLHRAASAGNLKAVIHLLEEGAIVDAVDIHGRSPLHHAVHCGWRRVALCLLDYGADFTLSSKKGFTVLHFASFSAENTLIEEFISRGIDVNIANEDGTTALHVAAKVGIAFVLRALLSAKANPNVSDKDGVTPLHLAVTNSGNECVKILLKAGGDCNAVNNAGESVLLSAVKESNSGIVKTLLNSGAFVDGYPDYRETPLTVASRKRVDQIVRILLDHGPDVKRADMSEFVWYAQFPGSEDILQRVFEADGDVNARDSNDSTFLHAATANKRSEYYELLLSRGIDVDSEDKEGHTPLLLAAENGQWDLYHKLKEKGAVNYGRNAYGQSALFFTVKAGIDSDDAETICLPEQMEIALDRVDYEAYKKLHLAGCNIDPLTSSFKIIRPPGQMEERLKILKYILQSIPTKQDREALICRADPEAPNFYIFSYVCKNGFFTIAEYLLQTFDSDSFGSLGTPSPLWLAADRGHSSIVVALRMHGAGLVTNVPAPDGSTPIMMAIAKGHKDVVKAMEGLYSRKDVLNSCAIFGQLREEFQNDLPSFSYHEKNSLLANAIASQDTETVRWLLKTFRGKSRHIATDLLDDIPRSTLWRCQRPNIRSLMGLPATQERSDLVELSRYFPKFNSSVEKLWCDDWTPNECPSPGRLTAIMINEDVDKHILGAFCCVPAQQNGKKLYLKTMKLHECLMSCKKPVHCRKVRSTLKALQEIEKEMNHPWSHLANLQPRFILVGSIGEGTRLGAFSELDFTVEFRGLNKSARLLLDSNNDATKLNIEGVQAKEKLARFCNRGFFDFATFLRHFLLAVWLAVDAARHRNAFPEEMALNPEVFNPCPQCFMLTESKYQESIYVPFSHCCQCLPAVTHTKLGACLFLQYKREGHEVAVVSVDLVPVFPLRAESVQDVLGLFDVVTKTLMTKKIPFWTEYYQGIISRDRVLPEDFHALQQVSSNRSRVFSVGMKIVHYGSNDNAIMRPAQIMLIKDFEDVRDLKQVYIRLKAIKDLLRIDISSYFIKKVLLAREFKTLASNPGMDSLKLLVEALKHPDLRTVFGDLVDYDRLEEVTKPQVTWSREISAEVKIIMLRLKDDTWREHFARLKKGE